MFDCNIGKDTLVLHKSIVRGVDVSSGRMIPDGTVITSQTCADALEDITKDLTDFKRSVVRANIDLVEGYIRLGEEVEGKKQVACSEVSETWRYSEMGWKYIETSRNIIEKKKE